MCIDCPLVRLWNDKAGWAKMRKKILDSPMSELDVAMLEKELSKVLMRLSVCVMYYAVLYFTALCWW